MYTCDDTRTMYGCTIEASSATRSSVVGSSRGMIHEFMHCRSCRSTHGDNERRGRVRRLPNVLQQLDVMDDVLLRRVGVQKERCVISIAVQDGANPRLVWGDFQFFQNISDKVQHFQEAAAAHAPRAVDHENEVQLSCTF